MKIYLIWTSSPFEWWWVKGSGVCVRLFKAVGARVGVSKELREGTCDGGAVVYELDRIWA